MNDETSRFLLKPVNPYDMIVSEEYPIPVEKREIPDE